MGKIRGATLKLNVFTFVVLALIVFTSMVSAADPGHSPSAIGPGTFDVGNYIFQNNLTVGGNNFFVNNGTGFVGIGTLTPSRALDVRGIGNFSGDVYINNGTSLNANLTSIISNLNSINVSGGTNGSDTYVPYIGASKNVVLGNYNLTVNGSTLFVSSAGLVGIGTTTLNNTNANKLSVAGGIYAATSSGTSYFTGRQLGSGYTNSNAIFTALTDNPNGASNYFFKGYADNSLNAFIRADGTLFVGNRTGIGTQNPSRELDVRGIGNFSGTVYINNGTDLNSNLTLIISALNSINVSGGTNGSSTYVPYVGANKNTNLNGFSLGTTGFIGAGVASPSYPLHVSGNVSYLDSALYLKNPQYDNLLPNGNFESVQGTTSVGWASTFNLTLNNTVTHNGLYSFEGTGDGTTVRDAGSTARIPIDKGSGERIVLEFWYNTSSDYSGQAGIWIQTYNRTGAANSDWTGCYVTAASTTWNKKVCTLSFDSSTKDIQYIQASLSLRNDMAVNSKIYIDDVKIYKTYGNDTPLYAGVFYDSDNSNYFINLSSTGNSILTAGNVGVGTTTPSRALDVRGVGNFSGTVYINNGTDLSAIVAGGTYNATYQAYTLGQNATLWASALNKYNATYDAFTTANNNSIWTAINNVPTGANATASFVPYIGASKNVVLGNSNLTIGAGRATPAATLDINGSLAVVNYAGTGTYNVGVNSFILGTVLDQGNITSSGIGSFAQGGVATGNITSSGNGAFAQGSAFFGNIIASNTGSFAQGSVSTGNITSSGNGAFAQGSANVGNITSSGIGSFAGGYANRGNIISSGRGSYVWGNASSSSGDYGIVFGQGVQNAWNNSFSVGFGQIGVTPTLFVNGTAVGIGTATPSRALDVRGVGNFSGTVYINNGTDLSAFVSGGTFNSTYHAYTVGQNSTLWASALNKYNATYATALNNGSYLSTFNLTYDAFTGNNNNSIWTAINAGATGANLSASFVPYIGASKNVILGFNNLSIGNGRTTPKATLDINGSLAAVNNWGTGGTYTVANSSFLFGTISTNGNMVSSGLGSIAQGYAAFGSVGTQSWIISNGFGAISQGYASDDGGIYSTGRGSVSSGASFHGNITSSGWGSFASGISSQGSGLNGYVSAAADAAFAQGYTSGGRITSSGNGAFAQGSAVDGAIILASNGGASASGYTDSGQIAAIGLGSIAQGGADSAGNITASGQGSFASGYTLSGNITSSGSGSFAGGAAFRANVTSSGIGSFVWGNSTSASGNYGIVFGQGVQSTLSNSFSVGFGQVGVTPMLFVNGTAVGIGTTTPSRALDVRGVGNFSGTVYINNGTDLSTLLANGSYLSTFNSSYNGLIQNASYLSTYNATYDAFTTNNNNSIWTAINAGATGANLSSSFVPYVGASKNVILGNNNLTIGAGRTTPAATLDINGSLAAVNYAGPGVYSVGTNSFILGTISNSGSITSSNFGSLAQGYATGAVGILTSSGQGSLAQGYATNAYINSSGNGAFAQGLAQAGGYIASSNSGSLARGFVTTFGNLVSSGQGSLAQGYSTIGDLSSSGQASIAQGFAQGGNIYSTGAGSLAQGYSVSGANINSSGNGAFAGGYVSGANTTSSGRGSYVWGNASSSSGDYGIVFGTGVANAWNNSFSVGFGQIGVAPTLFVNGTAVGIGTATPSRALDVRGVGNFSGTVYINNGTDLSTGLVTNISSYASNSYVNTVLQGNLSANSTAFLSTFNSSYNGFTAVNNNSIWTAINAGASGTNLSASFVPYVGASKNVILGFNNLSIGNGRTNPQAALDINGSLSALSYLSGGPGAYTLGPYSFILGAVAAANVSSTGVASLVQAYALGGNITASGAGSLAQGYSYDSWGNITASGNSSVARGLVRYGRLTASNSGASAEGFVDSSFGRDGEIIASGPASSASGYVNPTGISGNSRINSSNYASVAQGYVIGSSNVTASGIGSYARGAVSSGNLIASNTGSTAQGYVFNGRLESSNYGAVAQGFVEQVGILSASGIGSVSQGYTKGRSLNSSGSGSFAGGYANNGNIISSGAASFAFGDNIIASNSLSFALGSGYTNNIANSFAVGFDTVPSLFVNGSAVGIGTTAPNAKLDVQGDVILNASATGGNVVIQL